MKRTLIFITKLSKVFSFKEKLFITAGAVVGLIFLLAPIYFLWKTSFAQLPAQGGSLKEGLYQPINTLNPFLVSNQSEKALLNLILEKLLVDDGQGRFSFELAKNISVLDQGLKYSVELKDDKIWSNKEKITADDVTFSFQTLKKSGQDEIRNLFTDVEVEKLDNYQVMFKLRLRDNFFLNKLSKIYIVPKSTWQKFDQAEWFSAPKELLAVGSGPYRLEVFAPEKNLISFSRNPVFSPAPYIDKAIFKIYPDLQAAVEGVRLREVDSIGGLPANILKSALSKRLKLERIVLPRVIGLFLNAKALPNVTAAQIEKYINRAKLVNEIFGGEAEPTDRLFSPTIQAYLGLAGQSTIVPQANSQIKPLVFEQDQIEIVTPQNYFFQSIVDHLKQFLPLRVRAENSDEINSTILQNKQYQAIIFGINYDLPPNLTPFFFENSPFNLINVSNRQLTRLLQRLALENLPAAEQQKVWQNLQQEILNTNKVVFLVNPYYLYVVPKNLRGYNLKILRQPEERFVKIETWYFRTKTKWR